MKIYNELLMKLMYSTKRLVNCTSSVCEKGLMQMIFRHIVPI
jgi:hypothetical protein